MHPPPKPYTPAAYTLTHRENIGVEEGRRERGEPREGRWGGARLGEMGRGAARGDGAGRG